MVVLLLLYCCCLPYVWTHDDVSNSSDGSPVNSSRAYQYYHEALTSEESNGTNDFGWRIWGGDYIPITQAPYAVLYGWTCSGTLIAPNWVVTAAHCEVKYSVHVGAEYSPNTQEYAVIRHVFHPGWFYPKIHRLDFDCLLVQLAGFVPETAYTRPIAFGSYEDLYVGQIVTISGWGYWTYQYNMVQENSVSSDRLKAVQMTVIDYNYCATNALQVEAAKYGEFAEITPRMVCAEGNFGGATCFGDSGGPVVANNRLVGIVSWGVHCEPLLVFTNLVMLKGWISEVTGLIFAEGTPVNSTRNFLYYHEDLESRGLDAANHFDWRIWGGEVVSIEKAPYAVLYGWVCTGSLIAPNWLLTAAHCLESDFIRAGSEFQRKAQRYAIKRLVYHPGWFGEKTNNHDYDFLLLELTDSVPVTAYTRPIALGLHKDLHAGQPVIVSGWGYPFYKFNVTRFQTFIAERLRQTWMTLVSFDECKTHLLPYYTSIFHEIAGLTRRMSCALGNRPASGVCFGDSGGPVVANNRLVGLNSWVVHCEPLLMFANVHVVKDWVVKTVGL